MIGLTTLVCLHLYDMVLTSTNDRYLSVSFMHSYMRVCLCRYFHENRVYNLFTSESQRRLFLLFLVSHWCSAGICILRRVTITGFWF